MMMEMNDTIDFFMEVSQMLDDDDVETDKEFAEKYTQAMNRLRYERDKSYGEHTKEENTEELKKCPFCGGKAVFKKTGNFSTHHSVGFSFEIECGECGVKLPKVYKVEFSPTSGGDIIPLNNGRKQAVDDWNKRHGC